MSASDLLIDGLSRISQVVGDTVKGLKEPELTYRPAGTGNSIAWLVWHMARVIDRQLAGKWASGEVWSTWKGKFDFDVGDSTGYGHSTEEVDKITASPDLLMGYFEAVRSRAVEYISGLSDEASREIIDANWDPPVTVETRLVSILVDVSQHAGQAAYIRGLIEHGARGLI